MFDDNIVFDLYSGDYFDEVFVLLNPRICV